MPQGIRGGIRPIKPQERQPQHMVAGKTELPRPSEQTRVESCNVGKIEEEKEFLQFSSWWRTLNGTDGERQRQEMTF